MSAASIREQGAKDLAELQQKLDGMAPDLLAFCARTQIPVLAAEVIRLRAELESR